MLVGLKLIEEEKDQLTLMNNFMWLALSNCFGWFCWSHASNVGIYWYRWCKLFITEAQIKLDMLYPFLCISSAKEYTKFLLPHSIETSWNSYFMMQLESFTWNLTWWTTWNAVMNKVEEGLCKLKSIKAKQGAITLQINFSKMNLG